MNKLYTGVRVQTIKDKSEMLDRTKHNTRFKKEKSIKNNDGIFIKSKSGEWENISEINSKYSKTQVNYINQNYEKSLMQHKEIFKDFH
ncbi:MAG: hypothetical protein ACTSUT_05520, partial [Promethearchaeota archaeon]